MAVRQILILCIVVKILYVSAQTIKSQTAADCKHGADDPYHQYYHIGRLECRDCSQPVGYQTVTSDGLSCVCQPRYRLTQDNGGSQITCQPCGLDEATSADKWHCVKCDPNNAYNLATGKCADCTAGSIGVERLVDGTWYQIASENTRTCQTCGARTRPDDTGSKCEQCDQILSVTGGGSNCECQTVIGGVCFSPTDKVISEGSVSYAIQPEDSTKNKVKSHYFEQNLRAAHGMCQIYQNLTACQNLANMCVLLLYNRNMEDSDACELYINFFLQNGNIIVNLNNFQYNHNNLTACQILGNMCVLTQYDRQSTLGFMMREACSLYDFIGKEEAKRAHLRGVWNWPASLPWLYYDDDEKASLVLVKEAISTKFNFYRNNYNSEFHFKVAKYSLNGEFLGLSPVSGGSLQLCKDTQARLDAAYVFGTAYYQTCLLDLDSFWDEAQYPLVFYDLYLEFEENNERRLYAIPVLNVNYKDSSGNQPNKEGSVMDDWKLVRRFFLVDNQAMKQKETQDGTVGGGLTGIVSPARYVRYAKSMELVIRLRKDNYEGLIYPPYLKILYNEASYEDDFDTNKTTEVSFSVTYEMNQEKQTNDLNIAIGVITAGAVVWAVVQTWSWSKRSGRLGIDFLTIVKFLLHSCGMISSSFFIVIFSAALWWVVFFKRQDEVYLLPHTTLQESTFIVYLSIAFALKCIDVLHLIGCQLTVDIFMIDWERPKAKSNTSNTGQGDNQQSQENAVSIWRTYFVANEWNEIQSLRRINPALQIFATVFFLNVVGFEFLATRDPNVWYSYITTQYQAPHSKVFRFGLGACVFLIVAMAQWIFFTFIYDRFFTDAIRQFTDLCSMANISVFIMETAQFGYYIHGRSPHGKADTGLKEMSDQLKREEENLCGHRGLLPNTEEQVFMMALPRRLRHQYERVVVPLHQEKGAQPANRMERGGMAGQGPVTQFDKCVEAYNMLNRFLASFIDHSLRDLDYLVKNKLLFESILNAEFEDASERGIFYTDTGGTSFSSVLFFGNESTLMMFDVMLFSIVDLIAQNFILAGIIVFMADRILAMGRDAGGERNLAKKTLVDERFLI